jgi:nucleoside-diphosphate-sugar epimerase
MRANALGTFHILEAARLFGVSQVLFASSIGTYGLDIDD